MHQIQSAENKKAFPEYKDIFEKKIKAAFTFNLCVTIYLYQVSFVIFHSDVSIMLHASQLKSHSHQSLKMLKSCLVKHLFKFVFFIN